MQQLKRKLAKIDQEQSQFKTQQQKVEDDVSTLTQSMNKMGGATSSTFAKIWLS
jgi:hypothetical protein